MSTDPIERAKALLAQYPDCAAHIFIDVPDLRALLAEAVRLRDELTGARACATYSSAIKAGARIRALEGENAELLRVVRELEHQRNEGLIELLNRANAIRYLKGQIR